MLAKFIEHFHVTSSPSRLRRKTAAMLVYNEIRASVDIFIMLLICVESCAKASEQDCLFIIVITCWDDYIIMVDIQCLLFVKIIDNLDSHM